MNAPQHALNMGQCGPAMGAALGRGFMTEIPSLHVRDTLFGKGHILPLVP